MSQQKVEIDSYGRRKWNKEFYEKTRNDEEEDPEERLKRLESELEEMDSKSARKKRKHDPPPEALKAREYDVILDSKLGKTQVVTSATSKSKEGGYYCKLCDCVLKDSSSYLDHLNGKNHQRMLGGVRPERSTLSQVQAKLSRLSNEKYSPKISIEDDFEQRLENQRERERKRKLAKKERKKRKQLEALESIKSPLGDELQNMGLTTGFGSSKK